MNILKRLFHAPEQEKPLFCSLVLVAAGSASRMEGRDKILCELGDWPVLVHSLRPFAASGLIQEIIVVTRADCVLEVGRLCKRFQIGKVTKILPGGASRSQSVALGLAELSEEATLVAIHDGARPFVTQALLEEAVMAAAASGAAAPGIPVKDTIKVVEDGVVCHTPPREGLYAMQTPQVFDVSLIRAALRKAEEDGVALTDDCAAVEHLGHAVVVTAGSEENVKLTTPHDLLIGEAILARRAFL